MRISCEPPRLLAASAAERYALVHSGFAGVASAMILSSPFCSPCSKEIKAHLSRKAVGAAYGTSKAGIGITGMGTMKPELIMKVRFCLPLRRKMLKL